MQSFTAKKIISFFLYCSFHTTDQKLSGVYQDFQVSPFADVTVEQQMFKEKIFGFIPRC